MSFLHLTLFYMLNVFFVDQALEYPRHLQATTNDTEPAVTNIILQSRDGGLTWQDISHGLPENEQLVQVE